MSISNPPSNPVSDAPLTPARAIEELIRFTQHAPLCAVTQWEPSDPEDFDCPDCNCGLTMLEQRARASLSPETPAGCTCAAKMVLHERTCALVKDHPSNQPGPEIPEFCFDCGNAHDGECSQTTESTLGPICSNCDTRVPPGCTGIFKDDGDACLLNRTPTTPACPKCHGQGFTMGTNADDETAYPCDCATVTTPADQPRDVLLGESLRERAHALRREACGAWSDVVIPPYVGLDEAKADYAQAIEDRLRAVIDELADLSKPPPTTGGEL